MRASLILCVFACASWSCGSPSTATDCPAVSAVCPSPAPSYATDVAPIIESRCATCHSPAGVEPNRPYQTYAQVKQFQIDILVQVRDCKMPQPGVAPPLSDDERTTLLGWLYCDGPNN